MNYFVCILIGIVVLLGVDRVYHRVNLSPGLKQEQVNKAQVLKTFAWFNQHTTPDSQLVLSKDMVAEYFTKDAKMITNGQLVCSGIDEHLIHFREFQEKLYSMQIGEFIHVAAKEDKVYLRYTINIEKAKNQKDTVHVAGYMTLQNGKISEFNEVIHHS
tara:strand:+ start:9106 stop:9582 length:477 start_codon:yes stop_codon:yes gene_type:complete